MNDLSGGRRSGSGGPLWLDGGTATELQRAGMSVDGPWWTNRAMNSEAARTRLRGIHQGYLDAGAQVITANTFRSNLRALSRLGLFDAGLAWMVHAAVGVAESAVRACQDGRAPDAGRPRIAGSVGPVEDCYRPDLVPPDDELRAEHRWLATELMRVGVDLVLVETMNSEREARIALEEVRRAGARAWVGFVCDADARLLSGEKLTEAAAAVERDGAEAVLVNCTGPADSETALRALRDACSGPIGAYPNIEDRDGIPRSAHVDRHVPAALGPDEFADLIARWDAEFSLDVAGGCCGTTPAHLAAARDRLPRSGR
ncbi:S-methylmethionine-dependent homocysteine/selenocysteine methylase [Actinomadura luteofluorescens]|uniref:S-methylmethionine-dependent homocysteine/selenocysteine methylase n=1 Tax=Actinomadura luteofluorescens TaxID=46163 RepID=A0A7Y9ERM8_9ACTN|nr:homocysteine S-methyltransferase family protein [Actinomadura luteofluorescens]NYD52549.1 S-methylmethionine-dependent homocysteine/selenocysteine methylase [Actinomadura luteofluorescens]